MPSIRVAALFVLAASTAACSGLIDLQSRYLASDAGDASAESGPGEANGPDAGDPVDAAVDAPDAPGAPDAPDAALLAAVPRVRGPFVDFNGDRRADYAEHHPATGAFTIFLNGGSTFTAGGSGTTCVTEPGGSTGCDVLVGDFDGDGWGDYADHDLSAGDFEVHRNLKTGSFDTASWGYGTTCTVDFSGGGPCEIFVADFTGDGYADYADREPSTGRIFIHENLQNGRFAPAGVNWSIVNGCHGADCQVLVADFTGDGYADVADRTISTGEFRIHENLRDRSFAPKWTIWGTGHTCVRDLSAPGHVPCDVILGDFDGDGLADVVAHFPSTGALSLHPNRGGHAGAVDAGATRLVSEDGDTAAWQWRVCAGPSCELLGHRLY
jgi:hypothetical protein